MGQEQSQATLLLFSSYLSIREVHLGHGSRSCCVRRTKENRWVAKQRGCSKLNALLNRFYVFPTNTLELLPLSLVIFEIAQSQAKIGLLQGFILLLVGAFPKSRNKALVVDNPLYFFINAFLRLFQFIG